MTNPSKIIAHIIRMNLVAVQIATLRFALDTKNYTGQQLEEEMKKSETAIMNAFMRYEPIHETEVV